MQGEITSKTNLFGILAEPPLDALERGDDLGRVPELLDGAARLLRLEGHDGVGGQLVVVGVLLLLRLCCHKQPNEAWRSCDQIEYKNVVLKCAKLY